MPRCEPVECAGPCASPLRPASGTGFPLVPGPVSSIQAASACTLSVGRRAALPTNPAGRAAPRAGWRSSEPGRAGSRPAEGGRIRSLGVQASRWIALVGGLAALGVGPVLPTLWVPILGLYLLGALVLVAITMRGIARRVGSWRDERCTVCGYDLRGASGPICSECGAPSGRRLPPKGAVRRADDVADGPAVQSSAVSNGVVVPVRFASPARGLGVSLPSADRGAPGTGRARRDPLAGGSRRR